MEASQPTNDAAAVSESSGGESTDDLLRLVLQQQQEHRAEVARLREEINARKAAPSAPSSTPLTEEEALVARMNAVNEHPYYCPGCGRLCDYRQQCVGKAESPHPAIEVVSTDELKEGDKSKHTAPEYVVA